MNKELENVMTEEQEFEVEATSNAETYENYSDEDKTGFDIKSAVEGGLIALAAVTLVKGVKWCAKKIGDGKLKKEEQILAKAEEIKKRKTEEVVDVDEDEIDDCDFEPMTDEEIKNVQEEVKKPEKKKK